MKVHELITMFSNGTTFDVDGVKIPVDVLNSANDWFIMRMSPVYYR